MKNHIAAFQLVDMFDSLAELFVIVLFLVLLYFGWKSTEVRDSFHGTPLAVQRSSLSSRDVAIVPVRGNLLNRLVDQITTGSAGGRNTNQLNTW